MTTKITDPLPPPWSVPNAPLDIMFATMTPDMVRAKARELALSGAHEYQKLFEAAVRALGPDSPEAGHASSYAHCKARIDSDRAATTMHFEGSVFREQGYFISSCGWVGSKQEYIRVPTVGLLQTEPTMSDVFAAHEAATAEFIKRCDAYKVAEDARRAAASTSAPPASA